MSDQTADRSLWAMIKRHCASPRALVKSILQLEDTPHSIALGAAIGMWIALTPTPGIQMALVMTTAFLTAPFFRWNRVAGLIMCYVSNPVTGLPILWACYKTGTCFVGGDVSFDQLRDLVTPTAERPFLDQVHELWVDLGWPMLIGTFVVCTLCAILTYPSVYWLVKAYQTRRAVNNSGSPTEPTATVSNVTTAPTDAGEPPHESKPVLRTEVLPSERRVTAVSA